MPNRNIAYLVIALIASTSLLFLGFEDNSEEPKSLYRVYLNGSSIGLINSQQELEEYIDNAQEEIKEKYQVDKVYPPKNLEIIKEITFNESVSTVEEIYNKVNNIEPFTINGYTYTIKGTSDTNDETGEEYEEEDVVIYVLEQDVFEESIDNTIRSFVDTETYDDYLNETQTEIVSTGMIIENVSIKNEISYKQDRIPTNQPIYQTTEDLSKYLLFGTTEPQTTYTVQDGDTIEDVSFANKMSSQEFLIANPQFKNESSLLFSGQQVLLGILSPQVKIIENQHVVELQEIKYETEVRYDNTQLIGYTATTQKGQNGVTQITTKVNKENGQVIDLVIAGTETITPVVNEIIIKGGKSNDYVVSGDLGIWAWPTNIPYTISSHYGYRWGTLHDGTDIAGTGRGSPIKAAQDGVVVQADSYWPNGIFATVDHQNGYYTLYAHMDFRYVSVGDYVTMGQVIGGMGDTGFATGVHLHFSAWYGYPYRTGSRSFDAMQLYQ